MAKAKSAIGSSVCTSGTDPAGCEASITHPAMSPSWACRTKKFARGVDTFWACLWIDFDPLSFPLLISSLEKAKKEAQAKNDSQFVEFEGMLLEVSPTGGKAGFGFPLSFTVNGVKYLLSKRNGGDSNSHNAMALVGGAVMGAMMLDAQAAWDRTKAIIDQLKGRLDRNTCSRIDLTADLIGIQSTKFVKLKRWVCRARHRALFRSVDYDEVVEAFEKSRGQSKAQFLREAGRLYDNWTKEGAKRLAEQLINGSHDSITFGSGNKGNGLQFGKGNRVCRIYDKSTQLERKHPERYDEMLKFWGCKDGTPVTRVEFQVRGAGLRDLGIVTMEDALAKAPDLARYMVEEWCIGCTHYDRQHQVKDVAPLWRLVQDAFTSTPGVDPWDVKAVGGDGASTDDGFGKRTATERKAKSELSTAMTYLMRWAIKVHGGQLEHTGDICNSLREGVEEGFRDIGEGRIFEKYGDRLVKHWNKLGRETGTESWRVPSSIPVEPDSIGQPLARQAALQWS